MFAHWAHTGSPTQGKFDARHLENVQGTERMGWSEAPWDNGAETGHCPLNGGEVEGSR